MKYTVHIAASPQGSIGTKYCVKRTYQIEGETREELNTKAIKLAYSEGLEHVKVYHALMRDDND
jgi:hypothetical protein